ncbi:hypothetical protein PGT21_017139 [Puccinia graminis f. sp. tritici]|uniref:Uncharacterized protein n=1 Tax=Puccinia graminis f. sp. tritici TaxID=56615 RepID=A0A5B0P4Q4_PUCGR|nr:hypothetical protein PGT21_017139 [Puccinia graminis f. sp. tritici]KAA1131982.1 hypothetical protein PGTUg99_035235 [Puccinia graminis f. sp. tritici]
MGRFYFAGPSFYYSRYILLELVEPIGQYSGSQLVKHTSPNGPYYDELKEGLASITRVTDAVNETTRQRENELAVNDLKERVEDWKGHELVTFGQLVLEDTFTVVKNESETALSGGVPPGELAFKPARREGFLPTSWFKSWLAGRNPSRRGGTQPSSSEGISSDELV